jgi:peptide/nickel transport system substrate-binding protein
MRLRRFPMATLMRRFLMAFAVLLSVATPALAAKDELVIGVSSTMPSTFNPIFNPELVKSYILEMARRPFTTYDKDWKLICMLCTELPTIENGKAKLEDQPDGKHGIAITYTIQPGATWGDGVPITTDDVLFSWEVGRNPKVGVPDQELYRKIVKIDAVDKKTFVLHVDKVDYDYNAINDFELLPAHLERPAFADPENYQRRTIYDANPTNPGLWYGPYRITQALAGGQVVLEPNPTWYGQKPYFKRITVRAIENSSALEANLLSGSIDYVAGEEGFTIDQALAFEKRHGKDFNIIYKPGLIYAHVDLNLDNPILKDKRVRQALMYGMDRQTMVGQLFEGKSPVANSFVNPLDWMYDDSLPKYTYDPARAASLLDAAGWSKMDGGVRVNAAGQRLSLELMAASGNRTIEIIEQVLQSQWKKIGIDVRLRNEPPRVFFGETVHKRKFAAMAMFSWVSAPDNVPRTTLHSSEIPTPENNWAGQDDTGFKNAEVDSLIDKLEVTLDKEQRRPLWRRLQEIYIDEVPVLPLYFRADPFVMPKWLTGIEPTGHQYSTTLWVENWRAQ